MLKSTVAVLACVCMTVGCGGGKETPSAGSTTGANAPPSAAPATPGPAAGAPQPVTGKTWDVKMLGDASGYHFDPASITIKRGDGVRFTVVSGQPHNVTFWTDSIPPGSSGVLQGNMTQTTAPLTGPLLINPSETYLVSFGGAPAGTYHYYCTPHLAYGMKGTIVVQ